MRQDLTNLLLVLILGALIMQFTRLPHPTLHKASFLQGRLMQDSEIRNLATVFSMIADDTRKIADNTQKLAERD